MKKENMKILVLILLIISLGLNFILFNSINQKKIIDKKNILKERAFGIKNYIEFKDSEMDKRIKLTIKLRVEEAHLIATEIYNQYENKLKKNEVEKKVKDILRKIRFNNGRGYYFATRMNGDVALFSDKPEIEGENFNHLQDVKGNFVIKDQIEIVKKYNEGYYSYYWSKPGSKKNDHLKIAYMKYFEPFDLFWGTGDYVEDVETEIKNEIINRINLLSKQKNIFLLDTNNKTIAGSNNLSKIYNEKLNETLINQKEGFIEKNFNKSQIYFLKNEKWDWKIVVYE